MAASEASLPSPTESTADTVRIVMWVSAGGSALFVALRCYVRIAKQKAFGIDDVIAVVATLCLIAYAIVCTVASFRGLGRHIIYIQQTNPQHIIDVALLADIGESLAIMACTLGKTSFAVTLMRIVIQPWIHYLLWFIIITMNLVNVLAAIFVFVQCKDPRHLWNPAIPSKCWPTDVFTNFSLFVGAYSGAQDFVLALLPWVVIWRLQMSVREKLAIAIAMSLGVFAGATAIVKTTYLVNLSAKSDFTYALAPLLWWAAAEDGLTLVASSIPVLRPLLMMVVGWSARKRGREVDGMPLQTLSSRNNSKPIMLRPGDGQTQAKITRSSSKEVYDDGSDKSILEARGSVKISLDGELNSQQPQIVKTRGFKVTYE